MQYPLIALRGMTVFPQMLIHFDVGREKSVRALEAAMSQDQLVFLVAQRDLRTDDPGEEDLYRVGTISRVRQILKLPGDNVRVLVEGESRARLVDFVQSEPYIVAELATVRRTGTRSPQNQSEALLRKVQSLFEDYVTMIPRMSPEVLINVNTASDMGYLADFIIQNIPLGHEIKQTILEEANIFRRLEKVLEILLHENDILEIESDIEAKLRERMNKNQRDYFLREKIKAIQSELGESDDSYSESLEYEHRIVSLELPGEVRDKLLHEASRLSKMSPGSPETAVIRTYLDTCLELPWNTFTKDRLDIKAARKIMDNDHYGLSRVKERILEFMAVKRLAPELKGQILCLVGPPGVGKTSVAISLAKAMGRKYARLSLGGVRDEADIRGHRKTYIGAMPGRIINALRLASSKNALLLLDEIDKMGSDFRGDPAAAMLEVLDPEQNHAFRDHYLEVPFDLSDILFITTANTTDTIPRALLDRMEVIELTSYTDEEKLQIAKRHLIPKQLERHGMTKSQLSFSDNGIREIISGYTRESGVRLLEREIATVCRRVAKRIAEGDTAKVTLSEARLEEFLKTRRFKPERRRQSDEVGVANGLAWTRVGGELLEVEVGVVDGNGKVELTGNLGDIMKESAKAALTYIRSRTDALKIDHDFYKTRDMHIHFPEGAIPKDGPSAGITMAVAMVSALTNATVRRDVAMTGEITLRGRVLPIGGLKEKTMAAYRAGIKTVIVPTDNERDLSDIDETVHSALNFILADHMDKVLEATLDFSGAES